MKKISVFIFLIAIILLGCNPVAPSLLPSLTPESTSTSVPTSMIEPIPTIAPTSTPFQHVSKLTTLATFNAITAVSSENFTDVWAVGNDGAIVAYRPSNDQPSFFHIEAPEHANWYDVEFVSPDDGWMVGGGDIILHWNGEKWEVSKPATIDPWAQFYSYTLYDVAFSEINDGWATGCVNSEGGSQILVYHWDGSAWSEVSLPEELLFWICIDGIAALSPTDVWLVGADYHEGKKYGMALHWNGNDWEHFSEGDSFLIHSISALSSNDIWAIGDDNDIPYTYSVWHWDGNKWSRKVSLESANIIYARKPNDIFAIGDKLWHWNGSVWTEIDLTKDIYPIDPDVIDFIDVPGGRSSDLWLLDSSGIIYNLGLYWLDFGN